MAAIEVTIPYGPPGAGNSRKIRLRPWQQAILERMALLPPELIQNIIQETFLFHSCTIKEFAPRFSRSQVPGQVSIRMRDEDLQRIEVYTKGPRGQRGDFRVLTHQIDYPGKFFCTPAWPHAFDRRNPGIMALRCLWPEIFQLARDRALEEAVHIFDDTHFFFPVEVPQGDYRHRSLTAGTRTLGHLPFQRTVIGAHEERYFQSASQSWVSVLSTMRHVMLRSTARGFDPRHGNEMPIGDMLPADRHENAWLNAASVEEAVDYMRHLCRDLMQWLWLDWSRFSHLQTLYIDLSAWNEVIEQAHFVGQWTSADTEAIKFINGDVKYYQDTGEVRIRGLESLSLSLLVIMGLKSGAQYVPTRDVDALRKGRPDYHIPFPASIIDVEDKAQIKTSGTAFFNWTRIFRDALAEGGRLVFLDEAQNANWPGWQYIYAGTSHGLDEDADTAEPTWAAEDVGDIGEGDFIDGRFYTHDQITE